jgi:FK506-binding nuclear protein
MEPGRCYTQKVKVSFHVSMAALDISNSSEEPAQVMCVFEGRNYLLCTLNKKDNVQCVLDLNFEVHLTIKIFYYEIY